MELIREFVFANWEKSEQKMILSFDKIVAPVGVAETADLLAMLQSVSRTWLMEMPRSFDFAADGFGGWSPVAIMTCERCLGAVGY